MVLALSLTVLAACDDTQHPTLGGLVATPKVAEDCRPSPTMSELREGRAQPDPTSRLCDCADEPVIKRAADIDYRDSYFLSTRKWDDAYTCWGNLFLVYGNVGVDFDHPRGLRDRLKATKTTKAMASSWGGQATTFQGQPAVVVPPNPDRGSVGEILILIDGVMVRMIGNGDATEAEMVALARTFDLSRPL